MPSSPPNAPRARPAAANKIGNRLVALSSAAVLAVYTAGYLRTSAAADRLEASSSQRRSAAPVHVPAGESPAPAPTPDTGTPPAVSPVAKVPSSVGATAEAPSDRRHTDVTDVARQAAPPSTVSGSPSSTVPAPVAAAGVTTPAVAETPEVVAATSPVPAAEHPAAEVAPAPLPPGAPKYKDGTYLGWGTSRHGDIQASVVIEGGRIVSATIAQCLTRYSCSWIADLPPQVVKRQSPEVDYVSGATQSTNAFYYGIVEALAKAK